ncbi:MAG: HlyD family efflux transporter periplasmic adaptor subunit, partial [Planctomycetota bacterium]|nr:HlyD family efflux transporter periplasmic adaptor subunit [Planctomycetota bacterium]
INYKKALNALKTAEMELESYNKYKRPMELKAKKAGVVEAERGFIRAKKRADAQLQAKIAQVAQKKSHQQRLDYQFKRQKDQLDKMIIKAPTAGTVLYGDPDNPWMRQQIKVGAQVWHQMTLITLPDPSEMAVTLYIHEADIDKIKKGMKAFVTSETQKDKIYDGEVVKIDQVANAGRGGENIKRFKVEVALVGKDLKLKTGTSARVEVQIGEVPEVIAVPIQAVHAEESKYFCFGADGERLSVELGQSNDSFVEIKKGLAEGDVVLLYDPETAGEASNGDDESEDPSENGKP